VLILAVSVTAHGLAKPSLWQAQRDGQHVYLFGSIHIGLPSFYPLDDAIQSAFATSEKLWLEVAMDRIAPNELSRGLKLGIQRPAQPVSQRLPPALYQQLQEQAKRLELPMEQLDPYTLWFICIRLSMAAIEQAGYESEYGIDQWFLRQARARNKQVASLESFYSSFEGLAAFAPHQIELLQQSLTSLDNFKPQLDELIQAWQQGDVDKLVELVKKQDVPSALSDIYEQRLLAQRNQQWLTKLERDHAPTSFVVVGAAHLGGPTGLLALLKDSGYQVSLVAQ
jgi:uncharacterized protein YbaP (TraB family)